MQNDKINDKINVRRNYMIKELMKEGFIVPKSSVIRLLEREDTGRSELTMHLVSEYNLCIENADKQKTEMQFFQTDSKKSLYKRVDHMIFSRQDKNENEWKLYLIEMKSSVGNRKWGEVKGKFRSSYLLGLAIAGMLEMNLSETVMCTTYEKVAFLPPDTMPSARRTPLGRALVSMEEEWYGRRFSLNFGERIYFKHIPVPMQKMNGMLSGHFTEPDI